MPKKTGARRSGDPRKRSLQEEVDRVANESHMFWQEFRHGCGCYLQWGNPVPGASMVTHKLAQERMFRFFITIAPYPCPMHGSATGIPADPLKPGERRYLRANHVYYRECPPDRRFYGDRVSDHLGVPDLKGLVEDEDGPDDGDEGDCYNIDIRDPRQHDC